MKVRLAYEDAGLDIHLAPATTTVVQPVHREAAADQVGVLRAALRSPVAGPPLRDRVRPGQTVAISACDGTRPQPRRLMIPAVLAELDGIVSLDDVVVLVATGTHRGNDDDEQTDDISATVARALADAGPGARLCVLPEGPRTIPYLAGGPR